MTARPIPICGAAAYVVDEEAALPALTVNPEARDLDLAASAAALVDCVNEVLISDTMHEADGTSSRAVLSALHVELSLAFQLLQALIARMDTSA